MDSAGSSVDGSSSGNGCSSYINGVIVLEEVVVVVINL